MWDEEDKGVLTERAPSLIHPVTVGTVLQCSVFREVLRCQRQMPHGDPHILAVAAAEHSKKQSEIRRIVVLSCSF